MLLLAAAKHTRRRPSSARPAQPRPRHVLHAAATDADAARLTATLASSTVGRSFNFECQKQCWFIRRLPGAYQVTADGVEIVAEGPRSKLEAFERWLVKATTDTESFAAESGDGAGPKSVSYGAATGDLEGWTSRGAALDALKSAEGPGFLGAPAAGADESTNDAELADAMAEQAVVEIDYEAAAAVAATKGVVGPSRRASARIWSDASSAAPCSTRRSRSSAT